MATRLGLISDVHSSPAPLREALELFRREAVDDIICAGDIAGYYATVAPTVELLIEYQCKSVVGNHDQSYLQKPVDETDPAVRAYLQELPQILDFEVEQKRLFVVHANPPSEQHGGIRLLDQQGAVKTERIELWREQLRDFDRDILIVGHTHQVYAEKLDRLWVVNPGSSAFNHSCMILNLPECETEVFALGGPGNRQVLEFRHALQPIRQGSASWPVAAHCYRNRQNRR